MKIDRSAILLPVACHKAAKENGWWDEIPDNETDPLGYSEWIADKIDLIAGEGAEAVEALRAERFANTEEYDRLLENSDLEQSEIFRRHIKDTFEDEIADVAIRVCDLMGFHKMPFAAFDVGIMDQNTIKAAIRAIRSEALSLSTGTNKEPAFDVLNFILGCCFFISHKRGFDLPWHIMNKLDYNATRGRKHGKAF